MKKNLFIYFILTIIISCNNRIEEDSSLFSDSNFSSSKSGVEQSSILFGTINPSTGEFISIYNDPSNLNLISFPYIDSYNVAFYDNSYLLNNCLQNGKECIDLSHFIGKNIIPIESRAIPTFYGEFNSGFDNIYGSVNYRIFEENGYQNLLVTNTWMTNDAANTVLNTFRAEVQNNYQLKHIKAFRIHTKEYFGPSRRVIVEIKTNPY
ncbi:hypothetical protein ACFOWU_06190 [Epilithonimonas zeae]|uniref:Lipoprotein n=1 Tax=Epilithonimonas zeae TaxID=1416779 RepID=A0A1N6FJ40_9FLAO|nr:hypothetical protein [Epilithonimonas zeae]SIN95265.1 hypothetical protein SAMN05444409_1301 [Epilithonimonas zeae]